LFKATLRKVQIENEINFSDRLFYPTSFIKIPVEYRPALLGGIQQVR
jgi:hypothetical protein